MSIARAILAAARQAFNNRDLLTRDVEVAQADGEPRPERAVGYLVDPGVMASIPSAKDRRGKSLQLEKRKPAPPPPQTVKGPPPKLPIPRLPPTMARPR